MESRQSDTPNPFGDGPDSQWRPPQNRINLLTVTLFLMGSGILGVLLCCGGGIYWYRTQHSLATPSAPSESLDERIAATTAAYAAEEVAAEPATLLAISELLEQVESAAQSDDDMAFRALVDTRRLMSYVKQSPHAARANPLVMMVLPLQMAASTFVDPGWHEITVRHIEAIEGTSQFIVYTHCYDDEDAVTDVRFWIESDSWKIGDWERLDLGMRHSVEWALCATYAEDPRLENYSDVIDQMSSAVLLEDSEQARRRLRRLEARAIPPEFQDSILVLLGYHWNLLDDSDEALRIFNRVETPTGTPGAFFGKAVALSKSNELLAAIDMMHQYEAAVGPVPDACGFKADWLATLGRVEEEAEERKKVLRATPNDWNALESLALALKPSELDTLSAYLRRSESPLLNAEKLADTFFEMEMDQGLDLLKTFAAELAPDSAAADYISGIAAHDADDLVAAAELTYRSMQHASDSESLERHRHAYVRVMIESGRVVEAHQAIDERRAMLESWLADDGEENWLTDSETEELLAAHLRDQPKDPVALYFKAKLATEQGNDDAAIRALRATAELHRVDDNRADDNWVDKCHSLLRSTLVRAGEWREAYEVGQNQEESFQLVGDACQLHKRWEDLRQLLAKHSGSFPENPWTWYFRAALESHDEHFEEVPLLLKQIQARIDADESVGPRQWRLDSLRGHSALWEAIYTDTRDSYDAEQLFEQLASTFWRQDRYAELRKILSLHEARFPADLQVSRWEGVLTTGPDNDLPYVDKWYPQRVAVLKRLDTWQQSVFAERLVRRLLRSGKSDEARSFAELANDDYSISLPLILCQVMSSANPASNLPMIEDYLRLDGSVYELYDDETIGAVLRSVAYSDLHHKHPIEIPFAIHEHEVALLMKDAPRWSETELSELLSGVAETVSVTRLVDDRLQTPRFAVTLGEANILIGIHDRPLSTSDRAENQLHSERLQQAWAEHRSFVSVAGIRWARPDDEREAWNLVRQVAIRLATDNTLAFWFVDNPRLMTSDAEAHRAWQACKTIQDESQLGEHAVLHAESRPVEISSRRALTRTLRRLRRASRSRHVDSQFLLAFELPAGLGSEQLWMELDEIIDDDLYRGRLVDRSQLAPILSADSTIQIYDFELIGCRFRNGGEVGEAVLRSIEDLSDH